LVPILAILYKEGASRFLFFLLGVVVSVSTTNVIIAAASAQTRNTGEGAARHDEDTILCEIFSFPSASKN
jgi:hypothetical protein